MPEDYDTRRPKTTGSTDARSRPPDEGKKAASPRDRSRSPVLDERARREAARRAEMERLRAENEEEERRLAALDQQQHGEGDAASQETKPQEQIVQVNAEELDGLDEEEQMRKLLGIEGFGSTKGQKVESNHSSLAAGAAKKNKARKYRQYMNRKGGFNRPLDKMD